MKVDPRVIEPFNTWWRKRNHCEPDLKAIQAFAAGFKAGMERAVAECSDIIRGKLSTVTPASAGEEHG